LGALPSSWQQVTWLTRLLTPLAAVFRAMTMGRRRWLQRRATPNGAPLVVVGSIFIGGSGKTPLVIWLTRLAGELGYRPGIVARGYRGKTKGCCYAVDGNSDPAVVGDEAVMTARATGAPVVVGSDRCAAAQGLLAGAGCNLIISDDGLQHYRLHRDAEILVLDSGHGLGNGRCLPAGPLREPAGRLSEVDLVVTKGGRRADLAIASYQLLPGDLTPVGGTAPERKGTPEAGTKVHGVAGIGDPERFFAMLRARPFDVVTHAFEDHHAYVRRDIDFGDDHPVVMTEKDAVKCVAYDDGRLWYLPVRVAPDEALDQRARALLNGLNPRALDGPHAGEEGA